MKLVGVREAAAHLSGLIAQAQKERVVLTRHGKPIVMLIGVEGQDLESVLLSHDADLRRRLEYKGPLVSQQKVDEMIKQKEKVERRARGRRAPRRVKQAH
jgi:prevent-host-death family protein